MSEKTDYKKTKAGLGKYQPPVLVRIDNIRDITLECPNWQCSVTVPPPPEN